MTQVDIGNVIAFVGLASLILSAILDVTGARGSLKAARRKSGSPLTHLDGMRAGTPSSIMLAGGMLLLWVGVAIAQLALDSP